MKVQEIVCFYGTNELAELQTWVLSLFLFNSSQK